MFDFFRSDTDQTTREKIAQQFRSNRPDSITKRSSQSKKFYLSTKTVFLCLVKQFHCRVGHNNCFVKWVSSYFKNINLLAVYGYQTYQLSDSVESFLKITSIWNHPGVGKVCTYYLDCSYKYYIPICCANLPDSRCKCRQLCLMLSRIWINCSFFNLHLTYSEIVKKVCVYSCMLCFNGLCWKPWRALPMVEKLPLCPLVIALVPLKCSRRNLKLPHKSKGCPLPRRKCLGVLAPFKNEACTGLHVTIGILCLYKASVEIWCLPCTEEWWWQVLTEVCGKESYKTWPCCDPVCCYLTCRVYYVVRCVGVSVCACTGSSGYESTTKHKEEEEIPPQVRHKRPSVTITSPGSPGMTRRNGSPLVHGELQVRQFQFNSTTFISNSHNMCAGCIQNGDLHSNRIH